ncbi:MAG: hypothetical protein HOV94_02430, partial [Saccharothrix sp.]|nr:hypothetical protein [Saccharothrix sp.]
VVAPGSTAALYLAAAAWWTCTGLLMTVSGLHRLRGRAVLDAIAFGAAAVVVAVGAGGAWLGGLSPHGLLLVLLTGTVAITAVTMAALPREWTRRDPLARRLTPAFVRSTWLLGLSELVAAATISSVYLVLAAVGRDTDSGPFYLAMMASSLVCSFLLYQLKLHQPAASTRLRGTAGAGGRARATTLLRVTERVGLALAAVLVLALLVPASRDALRDPDGYVVLGVLVVVETVTAMVLMYAGFLLENTNSKVLGITGSTSVLRFAANLLFALALVPALGSVGGFAAIVLAMAAQAGALRRLLVRRHPELAGTAPA